MQTFIEFLEEEFEVSSYSGRCMYGKRCVSISGNQRDITRGIQRLAKSLISQGHDLGLDGAEYPDSGNAEFENLHKLMETLLDYNQDQLGLDIVIYWPRVVFEDER